MLKGLWKLTWVETKIFIREPMGAVGTIVIPVILFVVLGRTLISKQPNVDSFAQAPFNIAILAALMIAVSAVLSLVAIISIYREGGILKRLRATPLSPLTILSSQVVVKLVFTVLSLVLLMLAGRQQFPGLITVPIVSFGAALLLGTLSILSLGFVIASIIPTARFAQPIGAAILYPLIGISGLFVPLDRLPDTLRHVALVFPTTHAVALMQGVWDGTGWIAHLDNAVALVVIMAVCSVLATRVFRWE